MSHAYYKNIELLDDEEEEESDEGEDYNEEEEYGEDEDEEYDEDEEEEYDEDEEEEYDEDEEEEYDEDEEEEYDEDEEEIEDDNSIILQMRDGTNYNERTKEFNVIINLFVNKYRTALLLEIRDEGTDYLERTRPPTRRRLLPSQRHGSQPVQTADYRQSLYVLRPRNSPHTVYS